MGRGADRSTDGDQNRARRGGHRRWFRGARAGLAADEGQPAAVRCLVHQSNQASPHRPGHPRARQPDGDGAGVPRDRRTTVADHLAAVELQNAIRPGIAVCRFAALAALAVHEHPEWRERIAAKAAARGSTTNGPSAVAFAEEVRRYYPFVPLLPAVARTDLNLEGAEVSQGGRVLLDIYGTNRDERHWDSPEHFDPSRFLGTGEAFAEYFVPQGGGRPETGHRCPGEIITVGLLAQTVAKLSRVGCAGRAPKPRLVPAPDADRTAQRGAALWGQPPRLTGHTRSSPLPTQRGRPLPAVLNRSGRSAALRTLEP